MIDPGSLAPKFVVFRYLISWYINTFGFSLYMLTVVGSVFGICSYSIYLNYRRQEFDRIVMISILALIAIGGLIGTGYDASRGPLIIP